jgi:Amino acid permease
MPLRSSDYCWYSPPVDATDGKNTSVATIAASRLIFAIARDGVLPFSQWTSQVSSDGQPHNAVKVIWVVSSLLLCTILPSPVAFTSLVSAAGVPTITAYALIACTPRPCYKLIRSWSLLLDSQQVQPCKVESGEMVSSPKRHRIDLELVCRGSPLLPAILARNERDIQLCVRHFWRHHNFCGDVLVVYA